MKHFLILAIPLFLYSCLDSNKLDDFSTSSALFSGDIVPDDFKGALSQEWTFTVDYSALGTAVLNKRVVFLDEDGHKVFETRIGTLHECYTFKTTASQEKISLIIPGTGSSLQLVAGEASISIENPVTNARTSAGQSVACAGKWGAGRIG